MGGLSSDTCQLDGGPGVDRRLTIPTLNRCARIHNGSVSPGHARAPMECLRARRFEPLHRLRAGFLAGVGIDTA
jgi:hypothetical protein